MKTITQILHYLTAMLSAVMLPVGLYGQSATTITIGGVQHKVDTLIKRDIGPGTTYMRLRLPSYPLNVNMIMMDMTNPYNRVETFQGQEISGKTENMSVAAERMSYNRHKVTGGANGNFWCVSGQEPWSDLLIGTTFGGNVRNGQIITETNAYSDQWCGGPSATCVIAADNYNMLWIEPMRWKGQVISESIGSPEIIQVNKVVRENEIGLYNNYYPSEKAFMPVNVTTATNGKQHFVVTPGDATEVYLKLLPSQSYAVASDVIYQVVDVKTNAGGGSRGDADAVLVARGGYAGILASVSVGEEVKINHGWTSYANGQTPRIENLIQGLSLCMRDGVKLAEGNDNSYNNTVYSRTGYGSSSDRQTLYIIVIDKATDPKYGSSKGCNTDVMCDIASHYGCANLSSVDAGGSAEMLVSGRIINTTTEGSPRPVANGWMTVSTASDDEEITRIEFDELHMRVPPYSSSMPKIIGYNKYGDIVSDFVADASLTCDENIGKCEGPVFIAGKGGVKGKLTATYNGATVTRDIEVVDTEVAISLKPILIDAAREYFLEVSSTLDDKVYMYDPTELSWTIDDPEICHIDHHGILRGLRQGVTTITGTLGDFSDQTTVTVEIASTPKLDHNDWSQWTVKPRTGIKTISFDNGVYTYNYSSIRAPQFDFNNTFTYYSLPDRLSLTFESSVDIEKIECDLRTRDTKTIDAVAVLPAQGNVFTAGKEYTVDVPLPGPASNLRTYPVESRKISFFPSKNSANIGQHTLKLIDVAAHYDNYVGAVEEIGTDAPYAKSSVQYYNLQGVRVGRDNLTPGFYIVVAGSNVSKVLIR